VSEPSTHDAGGHTPEQNAYFQAIAADPDFAELKRRFRRFVFPVTAAFLAWYLLYVLLCAYARDFMDGKVVGNINVALVFGLSQFLVTFVTAWIYSRFADRRLDPLAAKLREHTVNGNGGTTTEVK
jgi:uncharacterized membrane protein (DUF485 family)